MRMSKISLTDTYGLSVTLRFDDYVGSPATSPYIVKAVDGLGPPELELGQIDNLYEGSFQNSPGKPTAREISILVGFNPDYSVGQTVESLREYLYLLLRARGSLPISVNLYGVGGVIERKVQGFVKRISPNIFSDDPTLLITLGCLGSFLTSNNANDAPSPGSLSKTPMVLPYSGSAYNGFYLKITFTGFTSNPFSITGANGAGFLSLATAFANTDILEIDTRPGSRSILRTRASVISNHIGYLTANSSWLTLFQGNNSFSFTQTTFTINDVKYQNRYWGV